MSTKSPPAAIDPAALALLVEIVDAGSLSAAARRKNTTRSAVSHRLKVLEETLGVQLLRRTTRRLEPTEIGLRLCERGRVIASELAQARAEVSSAGVEPRGSVRLSVPTGLGEALIGRLLIEFKRGYPDVHLEVHFANAVVDLLAEEIDVAVRIIPSPPEHLRAIELGEVDWVLCAAPAYVRRAGLPAGAAQLARHAIVTSAAFSGRLKVTPPRASEPVLVPMQPHLKSENFAFVKQAVIGGLGLGLLPFYLVAPDLAARKLVRVLPDHAFAATGRRAMLLAVPDRFRTAASRVLIEFLETRLRQELAALHGQCRAGGFVPPARRT